MKITKEPNASAKAYSYCNRCDHLTDVVNIWGGICDRCWDEINFPEEALYEKRKSRPILKIVKASVLIGLIWATNAQAWTLTAKGIVTLAQAPFVGSGPFGDVLAGMPYTMTISTDPELNGLIDNDDAYTHTTRGGTVNNADGAPYTLKVTVNGKELIQTEPFPSYNRSILQQHPVTFENSINQAVWSNGCSWSYGLCISANMQVGSLTPFIQSLDFDRQALKLPGKIFIPSSTAVQFQFRNGSIAQQSIQSYSYFYGSIDSLTVRGDK